MGFAFFYLVMVLQHLMEKQKKQIYVLANVKVE